MYPYIVAAVLSLAMSPFLYLLLMRRRPRTFIKIHTVDESKQTVHYLGAVKQDDTKYKCYVVEQK
jgi:hypothetical protein